MSVVCAILAPIAFGQDPPPDASPAVAPAQINTSTFVALPGLPLRIPLSRPPGGSTGNWVPQPIQVRLLDPDGAGPAHVLVSEIIGFTSTPADDNRRKTDWLAPPTAWRAVRPEDVSSGRVTGPVYWSLFVRLPTSYDAAEARMPRNGRDRAVVLEVAGERFPARLAEQPRPLPTGRIKPLEASAQRWREFGELLSAEAEDPARRWRASLLSDRFGSGRLFGTGSFDDYLTQDDPVLAGLGQTIEAEVRAAVSELSADDPQPAAELLARLTAVTRDLDGRLLPAWPTDGEAETILMPALLSRSLTAEERASRVRQYLDSRPASRCLVIDDAGQSLALRNNERFRDSGEQSEQVLVVQGATALATDVSGTARTLTYGPPGEFDAELLQLPAYGSSTFRFQPSVVRSMDRSSSPSTAPVTAGAIELRDGDRVRRLEARVLPLDVSRPGLQIGPALRPWTLASWNADAVVPVSLDEQTSVLIYRDDRAGRWRIMVEARTKTDQPAAHSVDLYFGPYEGSSQVITISSDSAGVAVSEDRWSTIIDLPEQAARRAESIGFIEFGFVRRRGVGRDAAVHSSWPRPWFPGQDEPGRFRIDLSSWNAR